MRMTASYVIVSVVTALLLELLVVLILVFVLARLPGIDQNNLIVAKGAAQVYALEAAVQANGGSLDPHSTLQSGSPFSLAVPEAISSNSQQVAFVLLISPNGQVLASSDPKRYPISGSIVHELSDPQQVQLVLDALKGRAGSMDEVATQGRIVSAVQPIMNKNQPIGAVYIQMQPAAAQLEGNIFSFAPLWLATAVFWVIVITPVGAIFGVLTTRSLVRRLHRLAKATAQFAQGDYSQRVAVTRQDEIGQLEQQFNSMAGQLVESIAQQKILTEQHARLEERARIEQELRTAQYIQRALLPKEVPTLPGWQLVPVYQPAREVGGDFYDFLLTEDGRLGIVIGDATDKGVSAALLMATTCTMLRTATRGTTSPGEVLARVNDLLAATIPTGVFVTCFYAMLDPESGRLCYANAGHDLPYLRHKDKISEVRATGMPLGLMPGIQYEEKEMALAHGDNLLFYSDGVVEAHNPQRDMFGFSYLMTLLQEDVTGKELIDFLMDKLAAFTGPGWEQEDDVTLVTLQRCDANGSDQTTTRAATQMGKLMDRNESWQVLDDWTVPSQPGNERLVMERVAQDVKPLHLPTGRLEAIKTAVAEATMNAMEHGNHYQAEVPVAIQVLASDTVLTIRIQDQGGSRPVPTTEEPDLEAKLAELQTPRGWGLFLIKNMVDEMNITSDEAHQTIELVMYLKGDSGS
ncbi:MAG TPA: SpoIIE family protein phosphatase [Ktedonobacteraceae bacterium]|nr:SpoIIE family protein phosphatase [Ktedonobacteraceae bacterium]